MVHPERYALALAAVVLTTAVAACGSGSSSQGTTGSGAGAGAAITGAGAAAQKGGKLTVLSAGDIDYLDPGQSYSCSASWSAPPSTAALLLQAGRQPVRDARPGHGPPKISPDGKTITVTSARRPLRAPRRPRGRRRRREVRDGARLQRQRPQRLRALVLQDDRRRPQKPRADPAHPGDPGARRLHARHQAHEARGRRWSPRRWPCRSRCPCRRSTRRSSTARRRRTTTSTWPSPGRTWSSATQDGGLVTGRRPGTLIELVRNPNWYARHRRRPPRLPRRDRDPGGQQRRDASPAGRESCRATGHDPGRPARPRRRDQAGAAALPRPDPTSSPAGSNRYVSMNTTIEPFDDVDVRKAVIAGFDRARDAADARRGERRGRRHPLPPPGHSRASTSPAAAKGPASTSCATRTGTPALAAYYLQEGRLPERPLHGQGEVPHGRARTPTRGRPRPRSLSSSSASSASRSSSAPPRRTRSTRASAACRRGVAICPNVGSRRTSSTRSRSSTRPSTARTSCQRAT